MIIIMIYDFIFYIYMHIWETQMANTLLKESPCKQTTESAGQNSKQIFSLLQEKVAIQAVSIKAQC